MEVENKVSNNSGGELEENSKRRCTAELVMRVVAFTLTLVAAILVGVSKETEYVSMTIVPTLPPLSVPATAKWHYLSAFVYFVVANSVACAYAAISLLLTMLNGGRIKGLTLIIMISDLLMVALLFSSGGAAAAVGLIGYEGNSHVRWNKVCDVFGKFCRHVAASLLLSFLGAALFIFLVLHSTMSLHKKVRNNL